MPTKVLTDTAEFHLEYDYDGSNRITEIRGTAGPRNVLVTAIRNSDNLSYQRVCVAGTTTMQTIPTGQAARLQLTVDALGRLDGVSWYIQTQ